MKQTQIVPVTVLIPTVASAQEAASGGAPADIVYGQLGQLVSVNGFQLILYGM